MLVLKQIEDYQKFTQIAELHIGVFASNPWLDVYGAALNVIGIFQEDGQLIGGFYFLKTRKFGFSFLKLPPYTPHCALFFINQSKNRSAAANFSKEVISEVCAYLSGQNAALTILAFPSDIVDLQPFIWKKYKVIPNYTYRINLDNTMDKILGDFDTKNRNMISKAAREDLSLTHNKLGAQELYDFFSTTLSTAGANIYATELKKVFFSFMNETNSFSLSAESSGQLVGAVFCVYDNQSCYYLLGGVKREFKIPGVNNLLIQKSIEKAKSLNCKIFDFEGSMIKGVEKFFRGFGPELVPYYTINKANVFLELLLKFKKREIF
jgi:hypothetical protein